MTARLALSMGVLLLLAMPAQAHIPFAADVTPSGGAEARSTVYTTVSTVGQASAGICVGSTYRADVGFWGPVLSMLSGVPLDVIPPGRFALGLPTPNPTRGPVVLTYAVPKPAAVSISLYDISGRQVFKAVDRAHAAGFHTLHMPLDAIPTGVYFCSMRASGFSQTTRLVVLH